MSFTDSDGVRRKSSSLSSSTIPSATHPHHHTLNLYPIPMTFDGTDSSPLFRHGSAPSRRTVDDVWKEMVAGKSEIRECKVEPMDEMMTLEDFLAKAEEEEGRLSGGVFPFDNSPVVVASPAGVYGNGGVARGKRRGGVVLEPMDKAAQQRQRRMIKNRESAARSRERKQAYQVELESLAVKLEEENERLLKETAERTKERFKLLMEKVVPVVVKRKPPARALRRVCSMEW